jgi:hypothetical protein
MRLGKIIPLAAAIAALTACAAGRTAQPGDGIARVNPASIALAPAQWDGRQVEMIGLLVWEKDYVGLYQSYGAYCRRGEQTAIHVDWSQWPGVTRSDNRRRILVRGTFRNGPGIPAPSASPGPGNLEPGAVVRWLSAPMKPCPPLR